MRSLRVRQGTAKVNFSRQGPTPDPDPPPGHAAGRRLRQRTNAASKALVEGGGFEPPKAEPSDLQSDPFGHSGTPPKRKPRILIQAGTAVNREQRPFSQ